MGDDTSKAFIVKRNNSTGVLKKNSDHLTGLWWQPLEVTTFSSLCVCLCMKEFRLWFEMSLQGYFIVENK